jgi:hypothetical protein
MVFTDANPTFFQHYTRGSVVISQDYDTGRIDIKAYIGTAPDSHTIIVYPYRAYECGYMNKGNARKLASQMKAALKAYAKESGIKFSEPIEVTEHFYR